MVDLVSELTVLCNCIVDFCTPQSCPVMRAGPCYEYAWLDPTSTEYTVPTLCSAPRYMELLLSWIDGKLVSSNTLTVEETKIFCRRLFRVYAHLLANHANDIHPIRNHLRYSLYHFWVFMSEFDLLLSDLEMKPIKDIINSFCSL